MGADAVMRHLRHLWILAAALPALSQPGAVEIGRASAPISIDGNVTTQEWGSAARIDRWYEFEPGHNVEPKVGTTAWLAYDDRFLYAAFVLDDPEPSAIRAPVTDRDQLGGGLDFAGLLLSPGHDGKTAVQFFGSPRGVQADSIHSDASGEDDAPDFFWDSAARITDRGWMLEMRIPFSSLRYSAAPEQTWGVYLYRNYPRDRRYEIGSAPIPRGANCIICHFPPLTGLRDLPSAAHFTVAPYTTAARTEAAIDGAGSPLDAGENDWQAGADVKWTPNARMAVDATLNPDFSQIESDVAAITANERFAIFRPEKRPFFLEGKDLFSTPIQAVHTRNIASPRWGARATGAAGNTAYTVLVADDRGGGAVIISGPNNSERALHDFRAVNLIGRLRHDIGDSFVSFLLTDREIRGGGHNRVFGPDALWRIGKNDNVRAQFLLSDSRTPDRPDLATEWDGRKLSSHAGQIEWNHSSEKIDTYLMLVDRGDDFRADLGFVPQVGTREVFGLVGYTFRPEGRFFNRIRTSVMADYTGQRDGALVYRFVSPEIGLEGRWGTELTLSWSFDRVRAGERTIARGQGRIELEARPSRVVQKIKVKGRFGSDIDFEHSRAGEGGALETGLQLRPTDQLELDFESDYRFLDVNGGGRLFSARVERLKTTWNFSARSFLRLVGENVRTDRTPALFDRPVKPRDGSRSISALYAYKVNWQTVLYAGYGDVDELTDQARYATAVRSAFVKVSYAWQR